MTRLMALDVGTVRIGVAVCDDTGFLASPHSTLHVSRNDAENWAAIQHLIRETEAEGIVIGLPISLDGAIHAQGQRIQSFADRLRSHVDVPLIFWDERLSTVEAQRLLSQSGPGEGGKQQRRGNRQRSQAKRKRRGHEIDALAAAVILQDYLDHQPQRPNTEGGYDTQNDQGSIMGGQEI